MRMWNIWRLFAQPEYRKWIWLQRLKVYKLECKSYVLIFPKTAIKGDKKEAEMFQARFKWGLPKVSVIMVICLIFILCYAENYKIKVHIETFVYTSWTMDWWPNLAGKCVTVLCCNLSYPVNIFLLNYSIFIYSYLLTTICWWEMILDKTFMVFWSNPWTN